MRKIFKGTVISVKMNKTAVVEVTRRTAHPLYKKLLKRGKKYKSDVGELDVAIGDTVKIAETRPISKDKHFRILEKVK
ncbi:MAG: 30S ribosomal protein S17 [Candidatus Levybacteria bacterium]|nr:30S ribosomal protein S17 [Candidatus Levybacteria bacterium]